MRTLLILALLLAPATWVAGTVIADEDALTFRTFDVTGIITSPEQEWGPRLGMLPSNHTWPERHEIDDSAALVLPKRLTQLVRSSVAPESWDSVEYSFLELRDNVLHVRNKKDVVAQVEAFLFELAAQARMRAVFSVEVVEGGTTAYPKTEEGSRLGHSGSLQLPLGVQRFLQTTNRRQFVVDYDVEIAQGSNISVPIVKYPLEGFAADVVVLPTRGSERMVVEVFVRQGRYLDGHTRTLGVDEEYIPKEYRSSKRWPLGTLECPEFEHTHAHVTALVAPGHVVTIPVVRGGRQQTFRFRVDPNGTGRPGRILDVAALTRRPMSVRLGDHPEAQYEGLSSPLVWFEDADPIMQAESIVDLAQGVVDPEVWENGEAQLRTLGNGRLLLTAAPSHARGVEAFLRARETVLLRPVALEARVYSVAAHVATGPSGGIDATSARLLAAGRLATLVGRRTSLMAGSTQNFLGDYDVEVAQEARVSDPIIGQAFEGLILSLLPRASLGGSSLTTEVELVYAVRTLAEKPFEPGAQTLGPIDRVHVERVVINSTVQMPLGGRVVLDGGRDPRDPNRRLAIELRAEPR